MKSYGPCSKSSRVILNFQKHSISTATTSSSSSTPHHVSSGSCRGLTPSGSITFLGTLQNIISSLSVSSWHFVPCGHWKNSSIFNENSSLKSSQRYSVKIIGNEMWHRTSSNVWLQHDYAILSLIWHHEVIASTSTISLSLNSTRFFTTSNRTKHQCLHTVIYNCLWSILNRVHAFPAITNEDMAKTHHDTVVVLIPSCHCNCYLRCLNYLIPHHLLQMNFESSWTCDKD